MKVIVDRPEQGELDEDTESVITGIVDEARQRLENVSCPTHADGYVKIIMAEEGDDVAMSLEACCEDAQNAAEDALDDMDDGDEE